MGKKDGRSKIGGASRKLVNRKMKKWKRINKGIRMEEWEEYFKELLEGKSDMEGEEKMEVRREERVGNVGG